jgi:hypothetical protein
VKRPECVRKGPGLEDGYAAVTGCYAAVTSDQWKRKKRTREEVASGQWTVGERNKEKTTSVELHGGLLRGGRRI